MTAFMGAVFALCGAACGLDERGLVPDGSWVGTITTEGNVTTVVNAAGSVWGGTATLVEEASIGVESGADAYMFGEIRSVYVTSDRIYVADTQVPAVRAYAHDGSLVANFGRPGQGPGEYAWPRIVAANESGRVFVLDDQLAQINVYASSGEPLETWPLETTSCCVDRMFPLAGGAVLKPVNAWLDEIHYETRFGAQLVGTSGSHGEVVWLPEIEHERATYQTVSGYAVDTPFSPRMWWSPAPDGGLVVGASDRYRFEVLSPEGSRLVVERSWKPVPIPDGHKEWERQRTIVFDRKFNDPEQNLDGSLIPDHKPAYFSLVPARPGETWVLRHGPSEPLADCPGDPFDVGHPAAWEKPCWREGVARPEPKPRTAKSASTRSARHGLAPQGLLVITPLSSRRDYDGRALSYGSAEIVPDLFWRRRLKHVTSVIHFDL